MQIQNLQTVDFDNVIALGNQINGANYLDYAALGVVLKKSYKNDLNCSFVVYEENQLIAFRLTYAPGQWEIDQWLCSDKWGVPADKVCCFKANMVDERYRGRGIGPVLLNLSSNVAKAQGAVAGVTHIWMQSPNNSAYRYFTRAGGKLIRVHPDRWNSDCKDFGYICALCGTDCHCDGAEMILYFNEGNKHV